MIAPVVIAAAAVVAVTLPGGTATIDHRLGTGAVAVAGTTVTVNYTGWLDAGGGKHGAQFDSSVGKAPFVFPLGGGRVIAGWDAGVAGMKVGGKRTLLIPAAQGYGERGAGDDIPPGAALVFDVELLAVE
jgi:FKBP-type peptidyl-prolyl cis-trans isomerase FkpA